MTYNRGNASAQVNANRNMDEEARRRAAEEAARKAEEERKRKEAEAKAKAEQEAAQRAAQEAAEAQNQQDNAPSTQNPGTSVMNFKPTAAQRHEIQTNTAWNRAEKKLVEAAPLDLLPPEMEDQREELEKKNQAGQLGSARLEKYSSGDNQYSVDATQFGNVKELAYFCSGLSNDADRVKLYKRYADENGLDLEDLYYQAETMLGGRAFNYPQSARGQMEAIGVYDAAGNRLDLGTATAAQVKQAIRMTPPGNDHDVLLKAYRRMYGDWGTDDSDFDFLDSADLTEKEYKDKVETFQTAFEFSDGQLTENNYLAYLEAVDDILNEYSNPRIQNQLLRQLALSYEDHTQMQAVSVDELNALAEKLGYVGTEEVDENGEKKGRFRKLWDWAKQGVIDTFAEKPEAPRHIPEVEEVTTSAAAAQGGGGASGGGYSGGGSASGYAAMGQAPARNTAEEAAAQTAAIAQAEDNPEVQGPVYRPQESATNEDGAAVGSNTQYISSAPYNADMTDSEALALWRKGEKLDERNMSQIGWLTENANAMGLVGNMSMYSNMGRTPSGGRNVVAKDVKYGNRLGTAAMVIGNGSLPEDIENETILTLGNVVDQIDRLVADPRSGISIPKGMNQYDYVLSLPQYAHLAEQVDATTGVMADVHAAYAQQAQLEKEAHDKHIETIKAKMLAGEGTPQMAQELAQAYGTEYVDLGDDEARAMYRFQMSEKSTFFTNDGTFWQNGSAAAQEGMNLMRMGGGKNGETFSTYKATLKNETLNLIDDYTTAAKQMGMTLAEYLDAAGISNIDQLVGIAYNDMISRGNAYSKDAEAQAAAQTFVDSDIGAWDAVGMGAQHGIESYGADFMQTTYMTIDAADYSTAVIDLQNEYTSKYGVDMAAAMYRADLLAYIDSGAMSEESAADLLDHMKRARSIFDVAYELDQGFLEGLARSGYEKLQKDVEGLEASAAHLPPELRTVFNRVSGGVYSLTGMGAATVFGGLTGSAAAGSALAWGGTEWSSAYDANRAKGMSPGMAGLSALGNAGIAAAVNMGGTGTDMDVWWKGSALPEFTKAMKGKNAATMLKDMSALIGKYAVKRGAEEAGEEVSETLFGTAFDLTDNSMLVIDSGKPVTPSVLLRSIGDAVRETDFDALGKELLTSAGMGFTMGGIFSLGGSAKTMLAAKKGINMRSRYASIDLAAQMAEGNVPFTEENIGKVYAAVQKDLLDARFRKYIDSNHSAALEQKATVAAAMMGTAEQARASAAESGQKAQEYSAKAEAAREASKTASARWWELRDRLASGDLSVEVELESARMQWQKAETTLQENENAAGKAMEKAQEAMTAWLRECRAQAGQIKSWMLQEQADQIASMRQRAAEELARRESENTAVMERENFIDERYPDADEETRRAIMNSPSWQEAAQAADDAEENRAIRNAVGFAGRLSKRFKVDITFVESIEGGAQGKYENGKIVIDKKTATQGEVIKRVMVHELTHKAESSKWYGELRDALVDIGYNGNGEKLRADVRAKMAAYNDHAARTGSGKNYTESEIEQEIVADLAGNLFTADEATIDRLVAAKPNLMQRVYETIRDFVRKLRGVRDPELDKIRNAEKLMRKALDTANGASSGGQYAIVQDESNWPIVKADRNFVLSDDRKEWGRQINAYIRDVIRDKGQMVIKTLDGEEIILDAKSQRKAKDWLMNGDENNNRVRKNASAHMDEVVAVSEDVAPDGANVPDEKSQHEWAKDGWRYREAVFEDYNGKRYLLTLSVGVDGDKKTVYNIGDVEEIEKRTVTSVNGQLGRVPSSPAKTNDSPASPRLGPSNTIISENAESSNRKYSLPSTDLLNQEIVAYRARENQPAPQTAMEQQQADAQQTAPEMGERQFATQTAQRSEAMPEWLKQELMSDPQQRYYERDSNNAQLMRAWERYQQEGYAGVRDRLLRAENFTADDIADANMIMAMAFRNDDVGTALEIAKKYNMEGTKEGQTLQARKIFKRMSPTGIRQWAAGEAETKLAEHISTHSQQKRDVDAAARRIEEKIADMRSGDEALRLYAAGTFTIDASNNRWGIPINEQQQALIDQYNLGSVARPGLFYNRATRKQRMLEAILATPNPLEPTGNGLNLIQRLEYIQDGETVITNADLNYIGSQLAQYAAMDADGQQEREGDLALSRAYEAYGNISPATLEEKARTWRYTSMLLSVPSAARNVIGNAAQNAVNATAHGIAVELDRLASLVTGERTMSHLSMADRVNGWNAFADETVNTFKDFYTDRAITANMHGDDRFSTNQRGRVYENQVLETLRLTEGYLMSVGDRNFWKKAYVNSIAEQQRVAANNGVELDMNEAAEIARSEANYAVFNEDNSVRSLMTQIKNHHNPIVRSVVDFIMPFTGVPTNITKRMIEYSPAGLLGTAVSRAYDAASGRNFDQRAFVTELSRGLTGTALFGLGMLMKEAGLIMLGTGDEDDSKVYGVRTAQGGQYSPYILVGDEYISLSTFAPAVSALTMGATAVDLFKEDEDALTALYNACLAGLDQIFDASYMSGLQDIFTGYGSTAENLGTTVLNSMVSQNVPAIMGQLATAMDPYVRDTKDKSVIMQALKRGLISQIPGLRETLPEKVDVAGRVVESKEGLRNFLDPFTTTKAINDPALDELMRLYKATGESSFMPVDALSGTKNTLTVNKEKIIVDGKDKETYKKRYGELWHDKVINLIGRKSYQRMSDEEKMEKIAEIVKNAKTQAEKEIAREIKRRK